jgi:hypothetical protein
MSLFLLDKDTVPYRRDIVLFQQHAFRGDDKAVISLLESTGCSNTSQNSIRVSRVEIESAGNFVGSHGDRARHDLKHVQLYSYMNTTDTIE